MEIRIDIEEYEKAEELSPDEQKLINAAMQAAKQSYAPYSGFCVGAAIRLDNDEIILGSNQENAAYPDGLCAERVAIFYAHSHFPDIAVRTLVVVAATTSGLTDKPVYPCGSCRQVFVESETRFKKPIRIIMAGKNKILAAHSAKDLLPLSFDSSFLKKR